MVKHETVKNLQFAVFIYSQSAFCSRSAVSSPQFAFYTKLRNFTRTKQEPLKSKVCQAEGHKNIASFASRIFKSLTGSFMKLYAYLVNST